MLSFLENFNTITGQLTALFLIVTGLYFSVKTKFFQYFHFDFIIKNTIGAFFIKENKNIKYKKNINGISSFQAFATSLGGTIGVGNIIGVSAAITAGGPGSIFWMWIAAFFGMIIKYSEIFLAVTYQNKGKAPNNSKYNFAPMNYIINGTGSKKLALLFAFFCILTSFLMGNMSQVNAISETLFLASGLSPVIIGIACSGLIAFLLAGGLKSIFEFIEKIVPIMSILYILGGLIIIIINYMQIIPAFSMIFKTAFLPSSAIGGIAGAGIAKAIQQGISKGIFSNEAGMGSGSLAHGSCNEKKPEIQGLWGAFEVFADTIVISSITALIILTSGVWISGGSNGVYSAFNMFFGTWGSWFTALCIFLFAITSIISWEYFGECCINYLFEKYKIKKFILYYRIIFIFLVFIGSILNSDLIWILAEICNTCMIFINMSGVLSLKNIFFKIFNNINSIQINQKSNEIKIINSQ